MRGRGMHFAKWFTSGRSDLTGKRSRTFVPQRVATHFNCQNVFTNVDVLLNWYTNNKSIINWLDMYTVSIKYKHDLLCVRLVVFLLYINLYTVRHTQTKRKPKEKAEEINYNFYLQRWKATPYLNYMLVHLSIKIILDCIWRNIKNKCNRAYRFD